MEPLFTNTINDTEVAAQSPDAKEDYYKLADFNRDSNYFQYKIAEAIRALSENPSNEIQIFSGGEVSDGGSGTIDVALGIALGKDENGDLKVINIPARAAVALPSGWNDNRQTWIASHYDYKFEGTTRQHFNGETYHHILEDVDNQDSNALNKPTNGFFHDSLPSADYVVWGSFKMSAGSVFTQLSPSARTPEVKLAKSLNTGYSTGLFFEGIDATEGPKWVIPTRKYVLEIVANNKIDIKEAGGFETITLPLGSHFITDMSVTADVYDYCKKATDAINANVTLSQDYTVAFSQASKKITVSRSGGNCTLGWATGPSTGANIGLAWGYLTGSDDTGAGSYLADNAITYDSNPQLAIRVVMVKSDADYSSKSEMMGGFVTENVAKLETARIYPAGEIFGFSGLTNGLGMYTLSAAITISVGVNDKINFKEAGGPERTATLTPGIYVRESDAQSPYATFLAMVADKLANAPSATLTYSGLYNRATGLFGFTGSGSFEFLFNTGTNAATSPRDELGYGTVDTGAGTTHTAGNIVNLAGRVGYSDDDLITSYSVFVGKSVSDSCVMAEYDVENYTYTSIIEGIGGWQPTPTDKDYGEEITIHLEERNLAGKGIRVISTTTSPATFKFQYSSFEGDVWHDSGYTLPMSSTAAMADVDNHGGVYTRKPCVGDIDEAGVASIAMNRYDQTAVQYEVWVLNSNDGGQNYTVANGGTYLWRYGGLCYASSMVVKEGKAVILANVTAGNDSRIFISNDTGSGYLTWAQTACSKDYNDINPSAIFIQYFAGETGINKHRIVSIGYDPASLSQPNIEYWKGDGTSSAQLLPMGTAPGYYPIAVGQDQVGLKNRIVLFANNGSGTTVYECETNEDYNGGVLTINNHSKQNVNSGGSALAAAYNGYSSSSGGLRLGWNFKKRVVVKGAYCYFLLHSQANPASAIAVVLLYTKNITGGTWESPVNIGDAANHCQEHLLLLLGSTLLACWKYNSSTLSNNLTNGIIKSRKMLIGGDGTPLYSDAEVIDGGEPMAGGQKLLTGSVSENAGYVSWERTGGSYDTLRSNTYF